MTESPDTIHGRMKEGAHIAGYGLTRAMENLKWLLEDSRFKQLSAGYENVNDFLRDTSSAFQLLRIDPTERKQIAELVKELQPQASQRAIADMVGASHKTIGADLGGEYSPPAPKDKEEDKAETGEYSPPPWTSQDEYDPSSKAKTLEKQHSKPKIIIDIPNRKIIESAALGDNSILFANIAALYIPEQSKVLDMTYGEGIFWKGVDENKYDLTRSDIEKRPFINLDRTADFTNLPDDNQSFDVVVFDPPYKLTGTPEETDMYRNKSGAWATVRDLYTSGIKEANRVLKPNGLLIVKCMDQVVSGKQEWYHRYVYDDASSLGMEALDLFVLIRANATPQPNNRKQIHAHKNHSFFWVFKKGK